MIAFLKAWGKDSRRPSDFKQYKRSIYNILCSDYKNEDNKIDREEILVKFISQENQKNFTRTNIYNKQGILTIFSEFFESQKNKGKKTRTVGELTNRNQSLVITIGKKYGRKSKRYVDREQFTIDYELDTMGVKFHRESPTQTPITVKRIKKDIIGLIQDKGKWTPDSIKPQYLKRLGKRYRNEDGKIDRLFIIYKIVYEESIASRFQHQHKYKRLITAPKKTTHRKRIDPNKYRDFGENPEEILIQKEELQIKEEIFKDINEKIKKTLSDEEQNKLYTFIEGKEENGPEIENILKKLQNKLRNNFN